MFEFIGIVIAVVALVMVIHLKNKVEHLEQKLSVRKDGVVQIPKGADADLQHSDIGDHKYDDVVEYIKKQVEEGIGTEDISRNLAQAGWQENDISVVLLRAGVASHEDSGISVNADVVEEPGENPFTAFFTWLTNDWLMKLGAFLILIAFGWFVTYAFAQNWIGPIGRITIGIVIGLAIMLLGEWRIREYKNQGAVLLSLGAAGILMTIFAARMIYDFFTPATALLFMFAVVVYLGLSSVRYKSKALAVLAIVLGFAVPLLTNSPSPDFASLFMYLLVVSGGVLWVAGITGWRPLILLSLIGMFLYSFAAFDGAARSTETFLFVLSLVFAGMYFITSMAAIVSSRKAYLSDLFTAAGVGAFTLMWIMVHFDQVWWSLGTAALALIFAVTAFAVYNITQMKEPFYVYGSVALVLIGVATALELEGPALTIAAIFEAVMVVGLIKAVLQDMNLARRATLLLVIPGVLSLGS
ncbi:MAG: DUF2339 domain-containing protein, partial [Candidatus Pacebacteria bacterium]|nr:DUF2339 domain-containing protein [Candidatus Paceibacterota bacterium]